MFGSKWLNQLRERLSVEDKGALAGNTSIRIYNLKLKQVSNPFSDELLWAHNAALGDSMAGECEGQWQCDWRLFAALNRYPAPENNVKDAKSGRVLAEKQVFTDVIIWIPQSLWDSRVREEHGKPAERLIENLEQQHYTEFKTQLWKGRRPRYCVMPDKDLSEGEMVCQFGTDIFVPGAGDVPLRYISVYDDHGNEYALPDLLFYKDGKLSQRPSAWYEAQHALQLSPSNTVTRPPLPFWLPDTSPETSIRLRHEPLLAKEDTFPFEVKLGELSPRSWTRRGEQEFTFAAGGKSLRVVVQPAEVDASSPASGVGGTHGGTLFPIFDSPTLVLQGIAIRPLAKAVASARGAAGWQLFLDDQCGLAGRTDTAKAMEYPRLSSLVGDPVLYWQYPGRSAETLALPCSRQVGLAEYEFTSFAEAIGNADDSILVLPNPEVIPLYSADADKQRIYRLGRHPSADAAHGEEAIAINLLDIPGTIFRAGGQALVENGKAITLGCTLSSTQVELELMDGKLWVTQLSRHIPSVLLDADGQGKKRLQAGKRGKGVLESGEYLWVGPYVFQFVDPRSMT
jgi:hypothetical protein